jgi:XTP/dITP diphosphohydrolase
MPKQLLLATHNKHKAREFSLLLGDGEIQVVTLDEFPSIGVIEENEPDLAGNARLKATEVHRQTGIPALGDDTGLEVYYLNGAPGVYSSRYSGEGATYARNVAKLLDALRGVPQRRRAARFRCVLAFVAPGGPPRVVEGVCRGTIIEEPRGTFGFGYDPIFLPEGESQTFAEMSADLKGKISHRGRAVAAMLPVLNEYFNRH